MSGSIGEAVHGLVQRQTQVGADGAWNEAHGHELLTSLREAGWLGVGLPEELGGEDGTLTETAEIVDVVSTFGWPSPVPDLLIIAHSVLEASGIPISKAGAMPVVVPALGSLDGGRVTVSAPRVPWAAWADAFLVVTADADGKANLAVIPSSAVTVITHHTLHGAPWSEVNITNTDAVLVVPVDQTPAALLSLVQTAGALARTIQTTAALSRIVQLTVSHVQTREQFGRALSAFQAVQQYVAELVGEVEVAKSALRQVLGEDVERPADVSANDMAAARVRTTVAAERVTQIAHQLFGAMGTTREHELHRHTTALWSWRDEFGTEQEWAMQLATEACAADDLWRWLLDEQ